MHTSGAKALVDSAGSFVGVKTPTYQFRPNARTSFSAACKAHSCSLQSASHSGAGGAEILWLALLRGARWSGRGPGQARLPGAQHRSDAFSLGDGEDTVFGGKLDFLDRSGRPVNLGSSRVKRIAKAEMRALIVGRDVAAAAHYVFTLANSVGA